jgi:Ca2+-binding EF-hand superfamily protein
MTNLKRALGLDDSEIERLCVALPLFNLRLIVIYPFRRQQFESKHGLGTLSKNEFYAHYGAQYTRAYSDHLFDLIDKDNNGCIDIDEWVFAKNVLEVGGTKRLRCACPPCQTQRFDPTPLFAVIFDFFDVDGDGYITEAELLQVAGPLYKLCFGDLQLDERQARSVSRHLPTFLPISDILSMAARQTCFSEIRQERG